MKRIPVTRASYKKISSFNSPKGVNGVNVSVGKPDKEKAKYASYLGWGGFGSTFGRPSMIGAASTFYNNSYMAGGQSGGLGDVPPYISFLNQQNGGVLYYPTTLKQKYEFYRYFYRIDSYVKAAVDLNTDLPMSRLQLKMPKMQDQKLRKKIQKFYQAIMEQIHLFDKLHSMLFQESIIGNCFIFIEYDEQKKRWGKMTILPPQEVNVANYPMSDIKKIQYRPAMLSSTIMKYDIPIESYEAYKSYVEALPEQDQNVLRDVSYEFVKQLRENNGLLTFDTDPYSGDGNDKIGSFVFHFANKRHEYQDLGVSPLECVFVPLLQKTHYMYTQLSLASRNMTPREVITAQGITPQALEELREQVDQSMLSPDYKIVTNYNIQWDTIGAENRLIDLQREYQTIQNQLFAGLGTTRQLLTGQGMYSGNRITLEVLNTKYLLVRQNLQKFVQECLFKPVALQNGFYHDDQDGNREWYYPQLSFSRLTIRDNQEVFDQLFQLYQKGSLPIGFILDVFNINSDDIEEELKKDMFTPKDATYNEMLRNVYSELGNKLPEQTDILKQMAESINGPAGRKLKYIGQDNDEQMGSQEDYSLNGIPDERPGFGEEMEEQGQNQIEQNQEEETNEQVEQEQESQENTNDQAVTDYLNKIKGQGNEEEGTDENVKNYLDKIKGQNDNEDQNVNNYLKKVTKREDQDVKNYLDKITKKENDENVDEYLSQILNKNNDENVKNYINKFVGQDNPSSQDDQQAGLMDNDL